MNRRWAVLALILIVAAGTGIFAFLARDGGAAGGGMGAATEAAASGGADEGSLRLRVDLSARTLTADLDGSTVVSYPVTVGTSNHPTPRGSYAISWIVWNPSWNPPDSEWAQGEQPVGPGPNNPMGRVKMFFREPAYYVHGTANEEQIGAAASHGCVRLRNSEVIELAQLVMEHGGEARPPNWFKRVINRFRDTREVRLSEPVPVVIE